MANNFTVLNSKLIISGDNRPSLIVTPQLAGRVFTSISVTYSDKSLMEDLFLLGAADINVTISIRLNIMEKGPLEYEIIS